MNWKISLDRWLTSSPNESSDSWFESCVDSFSDSFYELHESWIESDQCNAWMERLLNKECNPAKAASIIERAYYIYLQTPSGDF